MDFFSRRPLLKVLLANILLVILITLFSKFIIEKGAMQTLYKAKSIEAQSYLSIIENLVDSYNNSDSILDSIRRLNSNNKGSFEFWVIEKSSKKVLLNLYDKEWIDSNGETYNNIDLILLAYSQNRNSIDLNFNISSQELVLYRSYYTYIESLDWIVGVKMSYKSIEKIASIVSRRVWTNYSVTLVLFLLISFFILLITYEEQKKVLSLNKKLDRSKDILRKSLKREVKELRETKKHFIESEKMAVLGSLVGSFTHDISTPVGGVKTVISDLIYKNRLFGKKVSDNRLKKSELEDFCYNLGTGLDIAEKNIDIIVSQLDSFKRMSIDQQSNIIETVPVKEFINSLLIGATPIFSKGNFSCSLNCSDGIQLTTRPGSLSQIILNLFVNSVKHGFKHRDEGSITIDIELLDRDIKIKYCDDGVGIDKESVKHIWEPFYTTEKNNGGSGLGLYNVKSLVNDELKGSIRLLEGPGFQLEIILPSLNK